MNRRRMEKTKYRQQQQQEEEEEEEVQLHGGWGGGESSGSGGERYWRGIGLGAENRRRRSGGGAETGGGAGRGSAAAEEAELQAEEAAEKAEILSHPLFGELLEAHVACLRVATPMQHAPDIDAALRLRSHAVAAKYADYRRHAPPPPPPHPSLLLQPPPPAQPQELDHFMVNYITLLRSLKEYLQDHVSTQASEAISACWELEHALQDLTGGAILSTYGEAITTSDLMMPHDEQHLSMLSSDNIDHNEIMTTGRTSSSSAQDIHTHGHSENPHDDSTNTILPIDDDRAMVHHVRRELKRELKEDYLSKLKSMHDLIMRKARRSSKMNENNIQEDPTD